MNAIDVLKQQHRELERLYERLDEAGPDDATNLYRELADALSVHLTIEAQHFLPAVRRADREEVLSDWLDEPRQIKRLAVELLAIEPDDARYADKLRSLGDEIGSHVDEQEAEFFPEVERVFEADELEELGDEMEQAAAEMADEGAPRQHLSSEADLSTPN